MQKQTEKQKQKPWQVEFTAQSIATRVKRKSQRMLLFNAEHETTKTCCRELDNLRKTLNAHVVLIILRATPSAAGPLWFGDQVVTNSW